VNKLDNKIQELKNEVAVQRNWDAWEIKEADRALQNLLRVCSRSVVIGLLKKAVA
jgi:hypothetical protein